MSEINLLSIGEVAKRTGTRVSAVRFYADRGLIPFVRAASGHRFFTRHVIRRVSFILVAQSMGYSLARVVELLQGLPESRTPNKRDWQVLSKKFVLDIDGCLSLKSCRLYNPDDIAAKFGTGARYILGDQPPK